MDWYEKLEKIREFVCDEEIITAMGNYFNSDQMEDFVNELIINGENGFLCDNTPYSMALSLEKLMCNEKLMTEMGYAAKEHMKQFSPNKVWNMWDSLIKTTLQKM